MLGYGWKYLGPEATLYEAQYRAVIAAAAACRDLVPANSKLTFEGDALVVVSQLQGAYDVLNDALKRLHAETLGELDALRKQRGPVIVRYVKKKENGAADLLAHRAIDKADSRTVVGDEAKPVVDLKGIRGSFALFSAVKKQVDRPEKAEKSDKGKPHQGRGKEGKDKEGKDKAPAASKP